MADVFRACMREHALQDGQGAKDGRSHIDKESIKRRAIRTTGRVKVPAAAASRM
jgi:hypothetical protein